MINKLIILKNKKMKGLYATGINAYGQLGLEEYKDYNTITQVGTDTDWKEIYSIDQSSSYALKNDGTLWVCGDNFYGQLGLGDAVNVNIFTQVGTDADWKEIYILDNLAIALKVDGTLWSTGMNISGQLGLGDYDNRNVFTQVGTDTDWKEIYVLKWYLFAIKNDGTLWACGDNSSGQLGLGYDSDYPVLTKVDIDNYKQFIFLSQRTFAIKNDGTLWACGDNNEGQLGLGDIDYCNVFTQVGTDTDWKDIKSSGKEAIYLTNYGFVEAVFALKNDGTLWACGDNSSGQLGVGDFDKRNVFTQVGTDTDWKDVFVYHSSSYALKNDGTLWACGDNSSGQLGVGDYDKRNVFTQVGTKTGWKYIYPSLEWISAINNDGTIWTAGYNSYGQLGLGDNDTYHTTFTKELNGYNDWKEIHHRNNCLFAIKQDGSLWATGRNTSGQFGLGDFNNRNVLTKINLDALNYSLILPYEHGPDYIFLLFK